MDSHKCIFSAFHNPLCHEDMLSKGAPEHLFNSEFLFTAAQSQGLKRTDHIIQGRRGERIANGNYFPSPTAVSIVSSVVSTVESIVLLSAERNVLLSKFANTLMKNHAACAFPCPPTGFCVYAQVHPFRVLIPVPGRYRSPRLSPSASCPCKNAGL